MRQLLWATELAVGVMCGGTSLGVPGATHAASGKLRVVATHGYKFVPRQLVINAGDKVIWVNKDADQHTVTSDRGARAVLRSRPLSGGGLQHDVFSTRHVSLSLRVSPVHGRHRKGESTRSVLSGVDWPDPRSGAEARTCQGHGPGVVNSQSARRR